MNTDRPPDFNEPIAKANPRTVIYGNVTTGKDFVGRDKVTIIGSLRIPRWLLFTISSSLIVIVVGVLATTIFTGRTFFIVAEPTLPPMPPPTPTRFTMPLGSYNILVLPFRADNLQKEATASNVAEDITAIIVEFLRKDQTLLDRLGEIVGQGITIAELPQEAPGINLKNIAQLTQEVNAQVAIYGDVNQVSDDTWELQPSFYIPASEQLVEGSMFGEHHLAIRISYTPQSQSSVRDMTMTMRIIVTKMVVWLTGISVYERYDHEHLCQAAWIFEQTLQSPHEETEWLLQSCQTTLIGSAKSGSMADLPTMQLQIGNEISYLFLGNAYLQLAYDAYPNKESVTKFLSLADDSYVAGQSLASQNLRFTVGLAQSNFEKARVNQEAYLWYEKGYCKGVDANHLALAQKYMKLTLDAINLQDENKISDSMRYAEAIAYFGLGRISAWRFLCESFASANYHEATNYLQKVVDLQKEFSIIALIRPALYAELEISTLLAAKATDKGTSPTEVEKLAYESTEHIQNAYTLTQDQRLSSYVRNILVTKLAQDERFCIIASSPLIAQEFSQLCSKK